MNYVFKCYSTASYHLPRFQKSICFWSCPLPEFSLMWLLMVPPWAELLWRFASCSAAHSLTWFAAVVHFEFWLKYPCSFALTWFPRLLRTSVPSALERRASASRVQLSTGSFPTSCARWLESVNIGSLNFLAGRRLHGWQWNRWKVHLWKQVRRWELQPQAHWTW